MAFQQLIRWLLPKEEHFYDFLERQAAVAHDGAAAFARFRDGDAKAEAVRDELQALEHAGDEIVCGMEEALARTFVTPIDREDLQRLSAELDDILDLTNLTARSCVLYGLKRPTGAMTRLADMLVACTGRLKEAVPKLRRHAYGELLEEGRAMRKLEKEADQVFRAAISALFHDPALDGKSLLREKELLEDLERAIDLCQRVAGTLTNLAVKHG